MRSPVELQDGLRNRFSYELAQSRTYARIGPNHRRRANSPVTSRMTDGPYGKPALALVVLVIFTFLVLVDVLSKGLQIIAANVSEACPCLLVD